MNNKIWAILLMVSSLMFAQTKADFNGDGLNDLVIGVPGEGCNDGAVHVLYGGVTYGSCSSCETDQYLDPALPPINNPSPQNYGEFGYSFAHADFDGDGFDDLAIGAPGYPNDEDGRVYILYGSEERLIAKYGPDGNSTQRLTQTDFDYPVDPARFGHSLAAADFDNDGFADLAVGAPIADLYLPDELTPDVIENTGYVRVVYGSENGIDLARHQLLSSSYLTYIEVDIAPYSEAEDGFGTALVSGDFNGDESPDLAISAPGREQYSATKTGEVHVFFSEEGNGFENPKGNYWKLCNNTNVGTLTAPAGVENELFGMALAAADFNGDSIDDLAIGVPGGYIEETEGQIGRVEIALGTENARFNNLRQIWHQALPDIEGDPENWEFFGFSLASGDFNGDESPDLAIGVPKDNGWWGAPEAGGVNVIYSVPGVGLTSFNDQLLNASTDAWLAAAKSGSFFGQTLYAVDRTENLVDDLAIGAIGVEAEPAATESGVVFMAYAEPGAGGGFFKSTSTADGWIWHQGLALSDNPDEYDYFGASLPGSVGQVPTARPGGALITKFWLYRTLNDLGFYPGVFLMQPDCATNQFKAGAGGKEDNDTSTAVAKFSLQANYPNPFNPGTTIRYSVKHVGQVSLKVYNIAGQQVATLVNEKQHDSGEYEVYFDAANLPAGIYFYRFKAQKFSATRKMSLIK